MTALTTPPTQKATLLPYLALAVGIVFLSLSAMFVRWAEAPGPVTAFYRLFLAALILAPFFGRNLLKNRPVINKANIIFPIVGGIATAFDLALWNTSLNYTTAANATIIGNAAPMWVALAGLLLFGERLKRDFWTGLTLAMSGAILIVGSDFFLHPRFGIGDLMAVATSLFYATYYLMTERGRRTLDPLSYTWMVAVSAAATLFIINLVLQNPFTGYNSQTWMVFIAGALISQVGGYLSVSYALGHLPASVVSPTMIGQPIMTTLLAIPLLGEIPTLLQLIGGTVALTGIYLVNQAHGRAQRESKSADPEEAHA